MQEELFESDKSFKFATDEPEYALFIIWILYSTTIKIFGQPSGGPSSPVYAPHTLDLILAHATNNSTCNDDPTGTCVISSSSIIDGQEQVINKFCGTTIGAIAATCGIKVAYQVFMNSRIVSTNNILTFMKYRTNHILDNFLKWAFSYKTFRHFYSNLLGKLINTIYDIEKVLETPIEYCIEKYDSFVTNYQ
ncbi:hypothetical protein FRACYDRAFT_240715 [Fragilariopsis cylindrus CCMP1102]|uniref:Uncharacterized protein n=1 Tax=Fragilariopsis cylindrus CCMP1102 TaxID=635003 RepID=A0A1E7F8N2_9STRA|nr:hypothetical protein FRACYDRAFT_240715 [Fragilariopsis cylindrus CCMP1102]|eukprot:OEU14183.1 hypothetical protein FRACYDRAFT_240715 [Fragilariopsis cylindrus CCMP1102]